MPQGAKKAVQQRSQHTRDSIVTALGDLLREKPFDAIGVTEIAARADVSTATIYQRFANKDATISILLELYIRSVETWNRSGRGPDIDNATSLHDAFMRVGTAAWHQFDALAYIMRPAYLYSRLRPDLLGESWQAGEKQAREGFDVLLGKWLKEMPGTRRSAVAGTIAYFFNMMFLGRLLHTDTFTGWQVPDTAESFAKALADFACGYLNTQPDVNIR